MKKKLRILIVCLATICCIAPAQAQKKAGTPEERAAKMTAWMKTNLQLTAAQEPKVQDVNLKYAKKVQEAMSTAEGKMQKAKAAKTIDQEKDGELKQVLTPDQFSTYETKKAELKKKLKEQAQQRKKTKQA